MTRAAQAPSVERVQPPFPLLRPSILAVIAKDVRLKRMLNQETTNADEDECAFYDCTTYEKVADARAAFAFFTARHETVVLYARSCPGAVVWTVPLCVGESHAQVLLFAWAGLRQQCIFESPMMRLIALVVGALVRALLYLFVQRHAPSLKPRPPLPTFLVKIVNFGIELAWPTIRGNLNTSANVMVRPMVNAIIERRDRKPIKTIDRLVIDAGDMPLELTSISISPSETGFEFVDLDLGVRWHSNSTKLDFDFDISGNGFDVRGASTSLFVDGNVRIKFGPLFASLPNARYAHFGFTAKPKFVLVNSFKILGTGGLPVGLSLRIIDKFVNQLIEDALDTTLCWPEHIPIPLARLALGEDHDHAKFPPLAHFGLPIGTLAVTVNRCKDLIDNNMSRRTSDPYVVLQLGQAQERTPTVWGTVHPVWTEDNVFFFDIAESTQRLQIRVYDSEDDAYNVFADALLGSAEISCSELDSLQNSEVPGELIVDLDTTRYRGKMRKREQLRRSPRHSKVYITAKFTKRVGNGNDEPPNVRVKLYAAAVALAVFALSFARILVTTTPGSLLMRATGLAGLALALLTLSLVFLLFSLGMTCSK